MSTPVTSVRMTEDEIWAFLQDGHTGIFATLRSDGVPIMMPIWFAVVDRCVYVNTRGKKLTRIKHDSRASFLVEAGERWAELRAVHLTGKAEIIDPDEALAQSIQAELDRKYAAFRTARTQMPEATRGAYQQAAGATVRLTPDDRVLHWDNRKLGVS
jgi:nitroimidazol reductase NimA-like FMN-containing flavoprotein (pyridoxamine 5'-phosphate oxidase superfamily)